MQQIGYKLGSVANFLNTIKIADKKASAVESVKQEIYNKILVANTIISKLDSI